MDILSIKVKQAKKLQNRCINTHTIFINFLLKLLDIMCSQHFCNHFPKKVTEHSFSAIIKVLPQSLLLLEEIKIKIKKELANEASAC